MILAQWTCLSSSRVFLVELKRTILVPGYTVLLSTKFSSMCPLQRLFKTSPAALLLVLCLTLGTGAAQEPMWVICFSSLHNFFQGGHFRLPRNPHYAPTDYFPAPRGPSLRVLFGSLWSHSLPVQNLLERLLNPWPTPTLCFNSVFYHFIILIFFP